MDTGREAIIANKELWEREVEKGCGYTIPWLDLDVEAYRAFREGETNAFPEPPRDWIEMLDVRNKEVLCLALGGGQQSAVYSLLGGRVTVVDFAEGQIAGDNKAASHYGYEVNAICADMRDLSFLAPGSFDVVLGSSLAYIPDVREIYKQVSRVVRTGGIYRTDVTQPAGFYVKWNGEAYCIPRPYADRVLHREDGGIEFRHYMDDLFNGLIEAGFSIQEVIDLRRDQRPDTKIRPGSWDHERFHVGGAFTFVARKA